MDALSKKFEWVFFDVGGTIFDDEPVYEFQENLIFHILNDHGHEVSEDEFNRVIRTCRKRYLPLYINQLIWSFTDESEGFHKVLNEYNEEFDNMEYSTFQEMIKPLPGVRDLLLDLHQSCKLGIIGNQPLMVRQRLEEEKMMHLFEVQAISAEMELRKPDLRFFLAALALAGCQPNQTMMIGDRLDNDIQPARALGMTAIQLKVGPHKHQPVLSEEFLPHYTCSSIHQLSKLLLKGVKPSSPKIKRLTSDIS